MDETQLNDLKQFITATVSQATAGMATKDDLAQLATKQAVANLDAKIVDLELKVDAISEALIEQLSDHDIRLTKLEQQTV